MIDRKFHIVMVCTGNTCRSPMAEGILNSILNHRGEDAIVVSSAGISGLEDHPASQIAVEAAGHWGVDISAHRSKGLTLDMIKSADLLLAMSPEHVEYILRLEPAAAKKTFLIKAFPRPYSPAQEGVDDPIGGFLDQYNRTYLELDDVIRRAASEILKMASSAGKDS